VQSIFTASSLVTVPIGTSSLVVEDSIVSLYYKDKLEQNKHMNKFADSFLPLNPAKTTAIGHSVPSGSRDVNRALSLAMMKCRLAHIRFVADTATLSKVSQVHAVK